MKGLKCKFVWTLILAIVIGGLMPVNQKAYAADDLYLVYQKDIKGKQLTSLSKSERLKYKVKELNLSIGNTVNLSFIGAKNWNSNYKCEQKWKSSNTKVATVDKNGVIKAVGKGSAQITLTYKTTPKLLGKTNEGKASITVYVGEGAWNVFLGTNSLNLMLNHELYVGESMKLGYWGIKDWNDGLYYSVEWTSSDSSVASVSKNGEIKAKKVGKTRIKAVITNKLTGSCFSPWIDINVKKANTSSKWTNTYYSIFGEDYENIFADSSNFISVNAEVYALSEPALDAYRKKMDSIGDSGFFELLENGIKIAADKCAGIDMNDTVKKDAALSFINRYYAHGEIDGILDDILGSVEKTEKAYSLSEESGKKALKKDLYNNYKHFSKDTIDKIVDAGYADATKIDQSFKIGIKAGQYVIEAYQLFEVNAEVLDQIQEIVGKNTELYDDINMLKADREKNPVAYFTQNVVQKELSLAIVKEINEITGYKKVGEIAKWVRKGTKTAKLSDVTEATYMLSYMVSFMQASDRIREEIVANYSKYSQKELEKKIEEYEKAYSGYLVALSAFMESTMSLGNSYNKSAISQKVDELNHRYSYEHCVRYCIDNMKKKGGKEAVLDLSSTNWKSYNVGLDVNMYADKAYTIYNGAKFEVLGEYTNDKGVKICHVYSKDLGMKCYVTAKYVKYLADVKLTATPKPTVKLTATPKPTVKPTATPKPTVKPTATPKPTAKPTATPKPTVKPTETPKPTATPMITKSAGNYLYVGTLDISSTTWTRYMPDKSSYEMNGGSAGEIRQGSKLYVINEKKNSKGNLIAYVYSEDLKVNCYVTAKYIKKLVENMDETGKLAESGTGICSEKFNRTDAVAFALKTWDDGWRACAGYCARALAAGGIPGVGYVDASHGFDTKYTVTTNLKAYLIDNNYAKMTGNILFKSDGYAYATDNPTVAVGDLIFINCTGDVKIPHVIIVTEIDANGRIHFCSHNKNKNNTNLTKSYCTSWSDFSVATICHITY